MPRAEITALGCFVPPGILTNDDLSKMVETNDRWIIERTGIRERHVAPPGMATSDMAVEAAKIALAQRGLEASELDAIIVCTVTPDMLFPRQHAWFRTGWEPPAFGDSIWWRRAQDSSTD